MLGINVINVFFVDRRCFFLSLQIVYFLIIYYLWSVTKNNFSMTDQLKDTFFYIFTSHTSNMYHNYYVKYIIKLTTTQNEGWNLTYRYFYVQKKSYDIFSMKLESKNIFNLVSHTYSTDVELIGYIYLYYCLQYGYFYVQKNLMSFFSVWN